MPCKPEVYSQVSAGPRALGKEASSPPPPPAGSIRSLVCGCVPPVSACLPVPSPLCHPSFQGHLSLDLGPTLVQADLILNYICKDLCIIVTFTGSATLFGGNTSQPTTSGVRIDSRNGVFLFSPLYTHTHKPLSPACGTLGCPSCCPHMQGQLSGRPGPHTSPHSRLIRTED